MLILATAIITTLVLAILGAWADWAERRDIRRLYAD